MPDSLEHLETSGAADLSGGIVVRPPPEAAPAPVIGQAPPGHRIVEAEADEDHGRRLSATALLRSKWLILGVFTALSAAAIPPIWLFVVPKYSATASIRVAPVIPKLVYDTDTSSPWYEPYVNTQIANLTIPTVLQRVLEREEIKRTHWFREQPRTLRTLLGGVPAGPFTRLQNGLNAEPRHKTELIDVQMVATEGRDAFLIVNAVVDEYMRYVEETTSESDELLFEALRSQRPALEERIETLVEQMGNLSKQMGTDDPDIVRSQLAGQLGDLEMKRKSLNRAHQLVLWALESQGSGADERIDESIQYAADSEWARLNNAAETARHELKMAQLRYGESHPRIKELEADVDHADQLLAQREAQLGPGWHGASNPAIPLAEEMILFLDQPTRQWLADKHARELELLDEQIEVLRREQEEKGELAKQVAQISDQHRRERNEYERVLSRLRALEMEQKAPGRISVAARAVEPKAPSRDRRILLTLMALAGAMMMGVVVAHLRASINPKVFEADDVQHTVRVPFLGQLPAENVSKSLARAGTPLVAECMRMVRTALLERFDGRSNRAILITSASARAGKTSVALELAKSLARVGKKILLVEADLRRPTLCQRIGMEPGAGLAALLAGTAKHRQVIIASEVPKLDILPAGERSQDFDPELLANGVFAGCLARWKRSYDFVLVDSPPVLAVADARIIASQVDGTIMVSRASHCRRTDVLQACADLSAAGGPLLGTVLVGVRHGAGYGYAYGYATESAR